MKWLFDHINKGFSKLLEFFDSKSSLSNMRLNVTFTVVMSNLAITAITIVLCMGYYKGYTDGTTLIAWGTLLVGLITSALVMKRSQMKLENEKNNNTNTENNETTS